MESRCVPKHTPIKHFTAYSHIGHLFLHFCLTKEITKKILVLAPNRMIQRSDKYFNTYKW
ncbi:hypothetical protein Mpet_1065 [Methanolacinia petrolearia DSM 11571]|uniref:Uncharacterized protein n=1 Tax=Methanolacinia petrolearia (strain DSM 11571 / OCM 486 / SEBR 4847) TaxID=679926 RepID=E1RKH9_METP4|nr:hypothetical protein Mpet_1065 [Methanolacinia petrolearia DSM 11571]